LPSFCEEPWHRELMADLEADDDLRARFEIELLAQGSE